MPTLSPYQHLEAEQATNNRARRVLVGTIAVVACCAWWANSTFYSSPGDAPPFASGGSDSAQSTKLKETSPDAKTNGRLERRFVEISSQLPEAKPEGMRDAISRTREQLSEIGDSSFEQAEHEHILESELIAIQEQIVEFGKQPPASTPDDASLPTKVNAIVEQERTARSKRIANATETAKQQVQSQYASEIRTARLKDNDLKDRVAALKASLAKAIKDWKEKQEKESRDAALQRDMAQVRAYLGPFISPGHIQPNSRENASIVEYTVQSMPVSLLRLERLGALQPTMEGLRRLHHFGGDYGPRSNGRNARPRGSFPQYGWAGDIKKSSIRAVVQKAQNLLRQHSQALVDARLLSP